MDWNIHGGIAKFDGVNWTVYKTSNSGLPDNDVKSIAIDAQGNKWIGTWREGLRNLMEQDGQFIKLQILACLITYVLAIVIDGGEINGLEHTMEGLQSLME
jgi:ligand-binding sensor domain-containing protein